MKKAHKCLEDIFLANFDDSIESNYLKQIFFSLDYSEEICDDIKNVISQHMRTEDFVNKYNNSSCVKNISFLSIMFDINKDRFFIMFSS